MSARGIAAGAALAAAMLAAGCAEKPQAAGAGASRAKADAKPWQAERGAYGTGTFEKGDRKGWETALRTRAENQNEYVRAR